MAFGWLGRLDGLFLLMVCQRLLTPLAGSRPAASHFLLCEQEKLTKEKSPPLSATLR